MKLVPHDVQFFESPGALRDWFDANHETADELWLGYWKKATGRPSLTWSQAVDEALCVGWIDGVRKSIDEASYKIRFTPRKRGSTWSNINIKRCQATQRKAGKSFFFKRRNSILFSQER